MELPFKIDLNNKVVVITGAGGVICSYLAKAIAETGAKVALLNLHKEKADKVKEEIIKNGFIAESYACNVTDKADLERVHSEVLKDLGPCDILINGAGGNNSKANTDVEFAEVDNIDTDTKTFFDLDESGIDFVFNLNFLGTLLPSQVFARDMVGRSGCSILNISSMAALLPLTKTVAYSAAKASIDNFTKWLSTHFAHLGIRVNAIAPGFFRTAQNETLLFNADGTPTERCKKIINATPVKELGKVEDLVGATLFLISDKAARFVTGITLAIDGGFSSYSGV